MCKDLGFTFSLFLNEVHIYHYGQKATVLRGQKAVQFESAIDTTDMESQQQLMARITGNYKRGNEKLAKNHPRNRKR